ncbi:MAG: hypothetical protein ACREHF_04470 [Rhizomicrobium sp.]
MGWETLWLFGKRLIDHFWWLLGIVLVVEPWLDAHVERYRAWAERYLSRQARARVAWTISIVCLFVASAWAFSDEYWKRQGDVNALRGDLEVARGNASVQYQRANDLDQQIRGPDGYLAKIEQLNSDLKSAQNKPPKVVYQPAPQVVVAAPRPPARDPDTIYQLANPVGTVNGVHVMLSDGLVTFEEVDGANDLNLGSPFEYRNFVLQAVKIESKIGLLTTPNGTKVGVLQNVTCKILRR